jgi:hypothetical protein
MYAERARERERLKTKRRTAKRKAKRLATVSLEPSKTHPAYRRKLPPLPQMVLKSELRAFLVLAVKNTVPS